MKKYILSIATLCIIALTSFAQNGITPLSEPFYDGTAMYLYNVHAQKFYTAGNEWGTRASIGDEGLKVYLEKFLVDGVWDGKTVIFRDSVPERNSIYEVFIDNEAGKVWVDRAEQPNYLWELTQSGSYYRFSMAAVCPDYESFYRPGTYLGWDSTLSEGNNSRLWAFMDPAISNHVDWVFISETSYETIQIRAVLQATIEQAKSFGIDVSAYELIANNSQATYDELSMTIENLQATINGFLIQEIQGATPSNPKDATSFIKNPQFTEDVTAWQGEPVWGANCAEKFSCNFNVYQDLTGLPNGYYKVSVQGFYRAGDGGSTSMDQHASLYANEVSIPLMNINAHAGNEVFEGGNVSDVEGLGIVPNDMATASTAFSAGLYADNTLTVLVTDGTLRIGIKKETLIENDWTIFDNFELYYLGTESENAPLLASGTYYMKNVGADKYLVAANAWGTQASFGDHGLDVLITHVNGKYTIDTNVSNGAADSHFLGKNGYVDSPVTESEWTFIKQSNGTFAITTDGTNFIGYDGESSIMSLSLTDATSPNAQWRFVTKEELVEALSTASSGNPVDATFFIQGPNFGRNDVRNTAWQGNPEYGGENGNWCAEKFDCNFDVYQNLTGLPNGYYKVSVQGFYRAGDGGSTSLEQHAFLYANEVSIPLMNINAHAGNEAFESGNVFGVEGLGNVPNDMATVSPAFTAGLYSDNTLTVQVTDGTLRIGIKKETLIENDWTIFDNFELYYLGENISPRVAYLCGATETTEAIYTALVNAGMDVTPLNYDDVYLTEEIVANDFVGKYDLVVLAGSTGSSTPLAQTANLLLGKVNVLSTKSFWYQHYGTKGTNPGTAENPSLNLVKSIADHPIFAGIAGEEFAVFNDMAKATGRYLQGNGSFADGPEQITLATANGTDCIGEAWVNGKGYLIIPVDGAQPEGYLTADGEALYVNAAKYLIDGEPYEFLEEEYKNEQGILYQLNSQNTFTVTGYDETLVPDIVILENIGDKPVTRIKAGAFKNAYALNSVTIPSSITTVEASAFSGCHNLLVVKWNAVAPLNANCFDNPEEYGNMLVFVTNTNLTRNYNGNVVVNGVAENIQLIDGRPFRNPQEFTAKKISYTRHFTKKSKVGAPAGWEGMVLPFDVQTITSETKGLLAPFGKSNLTSTRPFWMARWQTTSEWFTRSTVFTANEPFIIAMPNSDEYDESFNIEGNVTFSAQNTKVHITGELSQDGEFRLNGCYESVPSSSQIYALNDEEYTAPRGGGVFMPGGAFVANSRDIRPFEAYIYNAQLATTCRYIPVQGGGIATGIDRIMLKEGKQCVDVYTLQGIMVKHQIPVEDLEKDLPKGIYVVDGKKFVVK